MILQWLEPYIENTNHLMLATMLIIVVIVSAVLFVGYRLYRWAIGQELEQSMVCPECEQRIRRKSE